ncbi:kinase-like protein [Serendipita vermifera]|nr:kinase-like protein [Serendipita vermifera]
MVRTDADTRRKLEIEMRVWASLNHINILPFYGYSQGFGAYGALISPWCENGHAGSYVRRHSIDAPLRFKLWCDVIHGLVYLHSHGVVHGDLKPSNVLIDDQENARICDFGLVRILSDENGGKSSFHGTPRYLAYELVAAERPMPTLASDIHALGCIGLDFIFLQIPYASRRNIGKVYGDIERGVPPATQPATRANPPMPLKELWGVLEKCWNITPDIRPSATEVKGFVTSYHDNRQRENLLRGLD